ncbi:uncharacterized protein ACRADG_008094 isoform 1-T1 [Cochliomyia hominivorax]
MIILSVADSLLLSIVLMALCHSIKAAPTHHLTIGVQGNTPTLIVTSSEIGITPETVGSLKKFTKHEVLTKSLKEGDLKKKSYKIKINKNHSLFNKKDKLQHLTKPVMKQLSQEEGIKALPVQKIKTTETTLKDHETTTIKLQDLEPPATELATITTKFDSEIYTTNLPSTDLKTQGIDNIPLTTVPLETTSEYSAPQITPKPKNIEIIPHVMSTTLNPKELHDITTDMNSEEESTITDKISKVYEKTIETKNNDNSQTQETTEIFKDKKAATAPTSTTATTVIKTATENENDNDRSTPDPVALTENENLLLTTIETKSFTTPTISAVTSTSTTTTTTPQPNNLDTLRTDMVDATTTQQILSLSLTMTTTENVAVVVDVNNNNNQNEQQQTTTTRKDSEVDAITTTAEIETESVVRTTNKEAKDKIAKSQETQNVNNGGILLKPKQEDTTKIFYENVKTSDNPDYLRTTTVAVLNVSFTDNSQNKMTTEATTEMMENVTTNSKKLEPEHDYTTVITNQKLFETSTEPTISYNSATEAELKLIDLEKHDLKTIDDLKQPSLLMSGQHDNGHDGLKVIKKKQLIDKHYVEALLHNKQDVHNKDSLENSNYPPLTPANVETSTESETTSTTTTTEKPLLKPIKHGYLGPILMEEKTFHVIHHPETGKVNGKQHLADIEAQLKKGHFVELKAKSELDVTEQKPNKLKELFQKKHKNIKNTSLGDKEELEMQSDQPKQEQDRSMDLKEQITMTPNKSSVPKPEQKHSFTKIYLNEKLDPQFEMQSNIKSDENQNIMNHNLREVSDDLKIYKENQQREIILTTTEDMIKYTPKNLNQANSPTTSSEHISRKVSEDLKFPTSKPENFSATTERSYTGNQQPKIVLTTTDNIIKDTPKTLTQLNQFSSSSETSPQTKSASVLSSTVFQVMDSVATKTPIVQANTLFTSEDKEKPAEEVSTKPQTESKISDIQIEVYDSTIDSIVASTNFKDAEKKHHSSVKANEDESSLGKTTKPPVATVQQERFTQYVIDRTETSTHEPINYSTIQVASGKPEPAAIEIHINVSESFGNESEDLEFSYPQSEYNNNNNERIGELLYEDSKVNDNIKLKIPSNSNNNGKDLRNDEILVVEIIDTDNITDSTFKNKNKNTDELFITDAKDVYTTPPPPPPPPPYQTNFDRDSDTIFYISNTEVKVGESLPNTKNSNEDRKLKLESQFFPANYIASTHPNVNSREESNPTHHLYEEDIILSSSRNQADSLKIYRNRNEPSPPLDVTYVGESIIEVEQSPDSPLTTTYAPDQQHNVATPQADVIIQPAILPEISIGVPVIGELPPQIELKEIDFMPNEAQLHRSGIYDDNDNSNNIMFNSDIDENTINGGNNNHDADIINNNNPRVDESSIQYGGDLIDESADGGFDGVEGSYPFGNPATIGKSSSSSYSSAFLAKLRKQQEQQQQPNHVADYAHLYVNYGVNNMRKDELSADVKDSGEITLVGSGAGGNVASVNSNEQNTTTTFKDFLNKVSMNNSTLPFMSSNLTQNERMSNATAFSVMEDANDLEDKNTEDIINLISLAIGLFIVILPVVVTCSMFWALRYLYKKYHSNLTDNVGYIEQTETKGPLTEDGVEKGEFVHEPSSSPTNSNKDAMIEKYPDTSNKPSTTTDTNVKFSSEKSTLQLDTSTTNKTYTSATTNIPNTITTITTMTNTTTTTVSKTNDTLKLSLALSSPITQERTPPPPLPPSATTTSSSPSNVLTRKPTKTAATEHIETVQDVDDNEVGVDDNVDMPGPNGSITKMTLENNLLIVETEERNDISRIARETKMDYNKDGVFVVEVARGIDSKTIPESPVTEGNEKMLSMFDTKQNNGGICYKVTNEKNCVNNEKVQIHSPPPENTEEGPRSLHQIEEVEEPANSPQLNETNDDNEMGGLAYKANTGLSQSDLSTTSSNDSNKGYCYGNQELYVVEQNGYSKVSPSRNVVLKCDVKDVRDDDRNPGNDHYLEHSPDRKEESKDKEDIVETLNKTKEGGSRTSSGESPAAKPTERVQEKFEEKEESLKHMAKSDLKVDELESKHLENCKNKLEQNTPLVNQAPICQIPVEIEVHITPAQMESSIAEELLNENTQDSVEEPAKTVISNVNESLNEEKDKEILDSAKTPSEVESSKDEESLKEKENLDYISTPEQIESPKSDETEENEKESLHSIKATAGDEVADASLNEQKKEENLDTINNILPVLEATESVTEPLVLETISSEIEEETPAVEFIPVIDLSESTENNTKENETVANDLPNETTVLAAPGQILDSEKSQDENISIGAIEKVTNTIANRGDDKDFIKGEELHKKDKESKENGENCSGDKKEEIKDESKEFVAEENNCMINKEYVLEVEETDAEVKQDNLLNENGLDENRKSSVEINGVVDQKELKHIEEEIPAETLDSLNGYITSDMESLTNGSSTLPDLVTELKSPHLENGHAEVEPISSSLTDIENGFDSIMSLPEPPPTTDEALISDISEQQMDSLPPPPPPEIFNLKDLPPPLTNGNVDSPQSEESTNFYNTLPPPPPTTLEVTATETTATTNGKLHASPLTPPASPPAHFTNNLHAGLCSQPIAVDVNGS